MKTKRTIYSLVVFVGVFCLSILFDIRTSSPDLDKSSGSTENTFATADTSITKKSFTDITARLEHDGETVSYAQYVQRLYTTQGLEDEEQGQGALEEQGQDAFEEQGQGALEEQGQDVLEERKVLPQAAADTNEIPIDNEDPAIQEDIPSKYSDIGISIAKNYVNIRAKANTESDVLGKLYKDSAVRLLDTIGDWYYVESGSVKGYVKSEYIKTGIPDEELITKYGVLRIRVDVDGLNVRKEPSIDSKKLTVVYQNEKYPVIELLEEWVKVDIIDDREIGYVSREMIEIIADFKYAVSKEEEAELLRLKEEERIKNETAVKYREEVAYNDEDLKLLACLVHSEAGDQSYEGKLAVANVVLNRVKSKKYPNTMKAVIYQPGQFTVAKSGSLQKQLDNYANYHTNSQLLSIKAARAALEGANNIGSRMYFHTYQAASKKGYLTKADAVKLQDHLFW